MAFKETVVCFNPEYVLNVRILFAAFEYETNYKHQSTLYIKHFAKLNTAYKVRIHL